MSKQFVDRTTRQYIEGEIWKDNLRDALDLLEIYITEESCEQFCKRALYQNRDEGGEIIEANAKQWLVQYVKDCIGIDE